MNSADGIEATWIDAPSESITIRGVVPMGSYTCREVRPGVYEYTLTPGTAAEAMPLCTYIDDKTVAITYRSSIPVRVFMQRSRKEIAAKLRIRRRHRAAFRRRKRGLQ